MDEQQSPQHSELRQRIIRRLNSTHALLTIKPNSNMRLLDHGNIIGTISYRQGNLIEMFPHHLNNLPLLTGQQTTTNHTFAIVSQFHENLLILLRLNNGVKIRTFDQQRFLDADCLELLCLFEKLLEVRRDIILLSALVYISVREVPDHVELPLDEVATLGDVLCGLHLVPRQHPHLNVASDHVSDR